MSVGKIAMTHIASFAHAACDGQQSAVGEMIENPGSRYRLSYCDQTGALTLTDHQNGSSCGVVLEVFGAVEMAFRCLTALRRAERWLAERG